ncbi:MAG: DUF6526 family protein [Holophagaceae bacterium]
MSEQQSYAHHRRFDPLMHFVLLPVLLVTWFTSIWHLIKYPSLHAAWAMVLCLMLVLLALTIRGYALKVQDRLIRLEESLRIQRLLPADLAARSAALTPKQCVGLRFAADAELADRVREALDENLDGEAIKKRIQTWRPDTFRV